MEAPSQLVLETLFPGRAGARGWERRVQAEVSVVVWERSLSSRKGGG